MAVSRQDGRRSAGPEDRHRMGSLAEGPLRYGYAPHARLQPSGYRDYRKWLRVQRGPRREWGFGTAAAVNIIVSTWRHWGRRLAKAPTFADITRGVCWITSSGRRGSASASD